MLKFAFNLSDDGLMGQQVFAGEATRLAYMTDEGRGGQGGVPGEARHGGTGSTLLNRYPTPAPNRRSPPPAPHSPSPDHH